MVAKASLAYPAAKLSDGEARVRLELYADALSDIPADVLGVAFLEAVKTIKFFPSVCELRALAEAESGRRWREEQQRLRESRPHIPPPAPEPELSAAEKVEVSRMLKDTIRHLSSAGA
jgi:hypothetical protein